MALAYQVALTNVWWKRGGQDTRLFSSKAAQKTYFDNKSLVWNTLNNFNIQDNIITTIVFRDSSNRDIETLLKCNYAIVKKTGASYYRYFYVTNIRQDSGGQVIANLELDDIQTNLVGNIDNFNCYIKKWTSFNYNENHNYPIVIDKNYIQTEDEPALYNIATTDIAINQYNDSDIDNWLNTNVLCWVYIFIVENNQIVVPKYDSTTWDRRGIISRCYIRGNNMASNELLPYGAMSAPVYKYGTTKRIYLRYEYNSTYYYLKIDQEVFYTLFNTLFTIQGEQPAKNLEIGTYGIEKKLSNISSLDMNNAYIDNNGDLIVIGSTLQLDELEVLDGNVYIYNGESGSQNNTSKANANLAFVSGYVQRGCEYNATASHSLEITKVSELNNIKLLDKNYSRLRVRIANQHYDYNPLALLNSADKTISFKYSEVLQVGITKIYLRAVSSGMYTSAQQKDYTGLIASLDLTLPLLTNQWAEYLANHKNYYMQTGFNNTLGLLKGGTSALLTTSKRQADIKGVGAIIDFASNVINQELDKDNMQQAPDSLSNANGDPYFYLVVDSIKPKLDNYQVKGTTKTNVLTKFALEGVPIEKVMPLNSVLFHHTNYDALSFNIFKTSLDISTLEFDRLASYVNVTHRYWYNDDVDITAYNPYYEEE